MGLRPIMTRALEASAVALHRLAPAYRVQTVRVKAGQPHISHDHDLEGVLRVIELVRHLSPLPFLADVFLPGGAVLGSAGHHHFERTSRNARPGRQPPARCSSDGPPEPPARPTWS